MAALITCNSHANSGKWDKIELVPDFMTVLILCKFDEDPIKNGCYCPDIMFPIICLWETKGQVTLIRKVLSAPKLELLQDFLAVLIIYTCKSDENSIKNEFAIVRTTFSPLYVYGRLMGK